MRSHHARLVRKLTTRPLQVAKGVDMSDPNPYVEARREWNDRYLELVRERRWWQIVAGTELALSHIDRKSTRLNSSH